MEQNQQLQVNLNKTSPVTTADGGQIWKQGFLLRKVSRFITGGNADAVIPIAVFYDPETGDICTEGMPQEVVKLIEDEGQKS